MELKALVDAAAVRFAEHGLAGWKFGLSASKRQLGVCRYRQRRIEISQFYAENNPDAAVLDTLLHEIAHALAGPKAKHGPVWKAVAVRIGATPRACDDSPDTVVEPGDWQTTCAACNKTYHRYKRPRALSGYRCKCPARSPLVYAFAGDPAAAPPVPLTPHDAAGWQATCGRCGVVHRRARRPTANKWRCRCAAGTALTWSYVVPRAVSG